MDKTHNPLAFPNDVGLLAVDRAGMTLRDYLAAHAPDVPLCFGRTFTEKVGQIGVNKDGIVYGPQKVFETDFERLIRWRWQYADAMLKAREA